MAEAMPVRILTKELNLSGPAIYYAIAQGKLNTVSKEIGGRQVKLVVIDEKFYRYKEYNRMVSQVWKAKE